MLRKHIPLKTPLRHAIITRWILIFSLTLTSHGAMAIPSAIKSLSHKSIRVQDGDTLYLGERRLRLLNIDTPETHKARCAAELKRGNEATERLRVLIKNAKTLEIVNSGTTDKYDRQLVNLIIDGKDAGQTLLKEGLAVTWQPGPNAWRARRRHWCGF